MGMNANRILGNGIRNLFIDKSPIGRRRRIAALIYTVVLVAVLAVVLILNGGIEKRSALRIGYVGNSGTHSWSGRYVELHGTMSKSLKPSSDTITVDVVTEKGTIDILMESTDGEVLYRGNSVETCSFKVKASGKVKITLKADHHEGSFSFE